MNPSAEATILSPEASSRAAIVQEPVLPRRDIGGVVRRRAVEADSRLWRAWHWLGMPLFYPLFALGCVALLLASFGTRLRFRHRGRRVRAMRRSLSAISRAWLWCGVALRLLEWEALSKPENNAGRLLVANHPTLIDILFLAALEPEVCCVLKAELNDNWIYARLIDELDYLSNADPERMLDEGARRLAAGESLLVFPEGTRTVPGARVSFRQGAAEIALRARATVLPVTIEYRGTYLSKGFHWLGLPPQKLRYRVQYGPGFRCSDLPAADLQEGRSERRRLRRALTGTLERHVNRGLEQSNLPILRNRVRSGRRTRVRLRGLDP